MIKTVNWQLTNLRKYGVIEAPNRYTITIPSLVRFKRINEKDLPKINQYSLFASKTQMPCKSMYGMIPSEFEPVA